MKTGIKIFLGLVGLALLALLLFGGKPPSMGGPPPGDFPAQAVVGKVVEEAVEESLELVTSLAASEKVSLMAELDGRVQNISFVEGSLVEQGAVLFTIDPVATQARLDEAKAGFSMAQLTFERSKGLLAKEVISQEEYDQAEAEFLNRKAGLALAEDEFSKTLLVAPFAGIAGEKHVDVGQFVKRGDMLSEIVSMDVVEAVIEVPERYLSHIKLGQEIEFKTDVYPEEVFLGTLVYIAPMIDEMSRTVRVKANIENQEGKLRPGQYGRVKWVFSVNENALVIPEACVIQQGKITIVIRVNAEGKSEFVPVVLGQRLDTRVEVLSGLAKDDHVVVEGVQKIWAPGTVILASPESENYGVKPFTPPGPDQTADTQKTQEPKA